MRSRSRVLKRLSKCSLRISYSGIAHIASVTLCRDEAAKNNSFSGFMRLYTMEALTLYSMSDCNRLSASGHRFSFDWKQKNVHICTAGCIFIKRFIRSIKMSDAFLPVLVFHWLRDTLCSCRIGAVGGALLQVCSFLVLLALMNYSHLRAEFASQIFFAMTDTSDASYCWSNRVG